MNPGPPMVHFVTIVLNGMPFIRYHFDVFRSLPFFWHWHIIEGVAEHKHDGAGYLLQGGKITGDLHHGGLSTDGTTEYLDELAAGHHERITLYRKPRGRFWEGKLEMVNTPLAEIREECLLWQIDADELWTAEQIVRGRDLFLRRPEKTAAFYYCHYFVGSDLIITTRDTFGNYSHYEWLRTWRFRPAYRWKSHEPPVLSSGRRFLSSKEKDVGKKNPFRHAETEEQGLVFQHYAFAAEEQLRFKEIYYGYEKAVEKWRNLQRETRFPVRLRDYFPWVSDDALVNLAALQGVLPLATKGPDGSWRFARSLEKGAG